MGMATIENQHEFENMGDPAVVRFARELFANAQAALVEGDLARSKELGAVAIQTVYELGGDAIAATENGSSIDSPFRREEFLFRFFPDGDRRFDDLPWWERPEAMPSFNPCKMHYYRHDEQYAAELKTVRVELARRLHSQSLGAE